MVGAEESPKTPGVLNGSAKELVQPAYPPIARSAHAVGKVEVLVLIDIEGKVIAAQIVQGHPLLRVASLKAATASQFKPTYLEGKPVHIVGIITYNFVANKL